MKKTKKAVLLSALVLPGLGHIFLKKYVMGLILMGVALAATYSIIVNTIERSLRVIENIQGGAQLSTADLSSLFSHQSTGQDSQLLKMTPLILVVCWVIGIADSYRIGRRQDQFNVTK